MSLRLRIKQARQMALRVVTWNLNSRVKVLDDQMAFLSGREPDIVTLQEVTSTTLPRVAEALAKVGLVHQIETATLTHAGPRRYGLAIMSRSPISLAPLRSNPIWPERLLGVLVQYADTPFQLLTTHIPPGSSNGAHIKIPMLEACYEEATGSGLPAILTGDFNAPQCESQDRVVTWAERKQSDGTWHRSRSEAGARWDRAERAFFDGMVDAYRVLRGSSAAHSWVLRQRGRVTPRRFDHAFLSDHWQVSSAEYLISALDAKLSDHAPLEVVLNLRSPETRLRPNQ